MSQIKLAPVESKKQTIIYIVVRARNINIQAAIEAAFHTINRLLNIVKRSQNIIIRSHHLYIPAAQYPGTA